jgi:dolichol-phosphate mannosyltransferase
MSSSSGMLVSVPDLEGPRGDPSYRKSRAARARGGMASQASGITPPPSFADAMDLPLEATVIVPTFNEREAIARTLLEVDRILSVLPFRSEILVVDDDSPDGTASVVRSLRTRVPLRLLVRREDKGLATAIIAGIQESHGRACVVMDADGSHAPDMIPALLEMVLSGRAEMALASRYVPGGGMDGWPSARRVMSRVATWLARPLTRVHDPMTGFFAMAPRVLSRGDLHPIGYKVVLEILVRCRPRPVIEVPFVFRDRRAGRSKMSSKEVFRYARHLGRLYGSRIAHPLSRGWSEPSRASAGTSSSPYHQN